MGKNQGKGGESLDPNSQSGAVLYEFIVSGHLDLMWSKWFEGMTLTHCEKSDGETAYTTICGPVVDQPALHGLLSKIGDLNLTLISVRRLEREKKA